jgi:hypothetical protein
MTFITLAMMTVLCLFIPIDLPIAGVGAVILLYFYTQQTLSLLAVLVLVGVAFLYLKRRYSNVH